MRITLLFVLLIGGFFPAAGAGLPERGTPSLVGVFEIVWGDGRPGTGDAPPESYFLTTDEGETIPILIAEEVARSVGGVLAFNRKRVVIAGSPANDAAPVSETNPWRASEIELASPLPQGPTLDAAVTGSQPWVSILCKFAGLSAEPEPLSYFQNMYASSYPGLDHYWREQSYDIVNVGGSSAAGWFTLPQPRSYYIYDDDGDGELDANLNQLATDCIAAADASVNYGSYVGINMMFNDNLDCCAWGGSRFMTLDGVTKSWRTTWDPPWAFANSSVMGHEMGHGFGLPHSSGMYGLTYDNQWDVMSDTWTNCSNSDHPTYGCLGSHTISYHKDLLEWFSAGQRYTHTGGGSATITLEQLALPPAGNYRIAIIPIAGSSRFYTVEVRRRVGYDVQLPGAAVIIHEIDPARGRPANVVDPDGNGDTGDAGAMWTPGETFTDPVSGISVQVNSASGTSYSVTLTSPIETSVDLTTSANPAASGAPVTFTATVIGGAPGSATGNMTFKDGASTLATVALVNATAAYTTSSLTMGMHSITAEYGGSVTHPAATSAVLSQNIVPAISINDVVVTEGNAGVTNAVFNVSLSAVSPQTVTVNYVTANNTAAGGTSIANSAAISIPSTGNATPYPSAITVSGSSGTITKATVTLNGLTHTWTSDLDILLVGPAGQSVVLMSDTGGNGDLNNVTLTFDDAAPSSIGTSPPASGAYKPTNLAEEPPDVFPAPAPAGGYGSALAGFNGTSANGTWSLYIVDDVSGDSGSIVNGWTLTITTSGSDYVATSGTLTFHSGTTLRTVTVEVSGDAIPEPGETFFVNLSGAVNAVLADAQGQGTITNDDGAAPPAGVVALATTTANVNVTWQAAAGAASYRIYRSSNGTTYSLVGSSTGLAYPDTTVSANTAYLYVVRSFAGIESADSNRDLATTTIFTDPTLTAGVTPVKLLHFTQLLTAVNAVRGLANLAPVAFTAPAPATSITVRRQHLLDLRGGLDAARAGLGLAPLTYSDPTVTAGVTPIKAAHLTQLRNGTQ